MEEREQTKNLEICILMASTDAVNMRKISFGCHSKLRVVSFLILKMSLQVLLLKHSVYIMNICVS